LFSVSVPSAARAAEDELWAWSREWSEIARATMDDKRLLRVLASASPGGRVVRRLG
jgi:hypothetical protein